MSTLSEGNKIIVISGPYAGRRGTIGEVSSPLYETEFDAVWLGGTIVPVAHWDLIADKEVTRPKLVAV